MTILSNAVKIANSVTLALKMQSQDAQKVTLYSYVADAGVGAPTYTSRKYNAVVEKKQRQVRSFSGVLSSSSATVLFLVAVTVKPNDKIVLADGTGGEVIGEGGPVDASGQLIHETYLA